MKKLLGFAVLLALVAMPASAASSLAVNPAAAMNGTNFGLQVNVDNGAGSNDAYVLSDHPVDESHILFRFWIKPMPGFSLSQTANSNFIRIGYGIKDSGAQGVRIESALIDSPEQVQRVDEVADLILLSRDALATGVDRRLSRPERVRPWTYDFDPAGIELLRRAIEHVAASRRPETVPA